jgi:hypothetical protein
MDNYLYKIINALKNKTGASDVNSLDYMDLPNGGKEQYNPTLAIGNINLTAGRFKTEQEKEELVNEFLNTPIPY